MYLLQNRLRPVWTGFCGFLRSWSAVLDFWSFLGPVRSAVRAQKSSGPGPDRTGPWSTRNMGHQTGFVRQLRSQNTLGQSKNPGADPTAMKPLARCWLQIRDLINWWLPIWTLKIAGCWMDHASLKYSRPLVSCRLDGLIIFHYFWCIFTAPTEDVDTAIQDSDDGNTILEEATK